jgi:hypothetical protein
VSATAPWLPRAPQHLAAAIQHVWRVRFNASSASHWGGTPGEIVSGTVTYDEAWSPFMQMQLTCRIPDDPAVLAALDPRLGARVAVHAGYIYPDGQPRESAGEDVHPIVNARVTRREVRRPQGDLVLTAMSEEFAAQRVYWHSGNVVNPGTVDRTERALAELILGVYGGGGATSPGYVSTIGDLGDGDDWGAAAWLPDVTVGTESFWSLMQSVADSQGVWLYHNGLDKWQMHERPAKASTSAAQLRTGPGGLIASSDAGISLEDGWYNSVQLIHEWERANGTRQRRATRCSVSSGPMSVSAVGYHTLVLQRATPINATPIRRAAAALVRRTVTRGRTYTLTAPAMYWLRPGHTVTVLLPTGSQERHLVAAVTFDLPTGLMTVTTRLPESVNIEGAD